MSDLWIDGRDQCDVAELCKTQPNLVGYNYVEDVTVLREGIATLEAQLAAERERVVPRGGEGQRGRARRGQGDGEGAAGEWSPRSERPFQR